MTETLLMFPSHEGSFFPPHRFDLMFFVQKMKDDFLSPRDFSFKKSRTTFQFVFFSFIFLSFLSFFCFSRPLCLRLDDAIVKSL